MMNSAQSDKLLARFVAEKSNEVFGDIVAEYSGLVYSTALRRLDGATGPAEDVTQEVFCLLAKKAGKLPRNVSLGGWLYRNTCHLAANEMRAHKRRLKRETIASELMTQKSESLPREIIAEIDDALLTLPKVSRDLIVMRYFEGAGYRQLAVRFDLSEEAARKRISRSLEKLQMILSKRGLKIAGPALAAGMAALSLQKVSATGQARIVGLAISSPGVKASLLAHAAALLVGAAGVSVAAAGATKFLRQSKNKMGEPEPRVTSIRTDPKKPGWHQNISTGDLISRIQSLSGRPQHALMELEMDALLEQISNEGIPRFVEESMAALSLDAREICYKRLFVRWADSDPGAANLAAMRLNVGPQAKMGTWLYRSIANRWARRDPDAMSTWLLDHWDEIEGFNLEAYQSSLIHNLASTAVDAFESQRGIEQALQHLKKYPPATQLSAFRNLIGGTLRGMHGSSAPSLYHYLKENQMSAEYQKMTRAFFVNWAGIDAGGMLRVLQNEPPSDRFEAYLNLFGEIMSHGPFIENADGSLISNGHNKAYASLTKREEMAFDSGLAAGLTPDLIHEEIASAYQNTLPNSTWIKVLAENRKEPQREIIIEGKDSFYSQVSQQTQEVLSTPEEDFHAALWNAALLTEEGLRTEFCQELCKAYLERARESALEFAKAKHIPGTLRMIFETQLGE